MALGMMVQMGMVHLGMMVCMMVQLGLEDVPFAENGAMNLCFEFLPIDGLVELGRMVELCDKKNGSEFFQKRCCSVNHNRHEVNLTIAKITSPAELIDKI